MRQGSVLFVLLLAAACGKHEETTAADAAAASAAPLAPLPVHWHYVVDAKSAAHVAVTEGLRPLQADTTAAMGSLDVTPADLGQSRGAVSIDLSTLAVRGEADGGTDASLTRSALAWLEVVGGRSSESMRWATFAIRAIDGLSAMTLSAVAPTREGSDDMRTVTMTVHGDLLVHDHKFQRDAVVDVSFYSPAGTAPGEQPSRVEIVPKVPLELTLAEVDARPHPDAGKAAPSTAAQLAKFGKVADVTATIRATYLSAGPYPDARRAVGSRGGLFGGQARAHRERS